MSLQRFLESMVPRLGIIRKTGPYGSHFTRLTRSGIRSHPLSVIRAATSNAVWLKLLENDAREKRIYIC